MLNTDALRDWILANEDTTETEYPEWNEEEVVTKTRDIKDTFQKHYNGTKRLQRNVDALHFIDGYNADIRIMTAEKISEALRLSKDESLLLKYFAAQDEGFTPANKTIEAATGIKAGHVSEIKTQLENKGIITRYRMCNKKSGYKYIVEIDWNNLFRTASKLKDNKPKTVRIDGKVVRIPVVKEIEHIDFDTADLMMIEQNSKSCCFRCDNNCECCEYYAAEKKRIAAEKKRAAKRVSKINYYDMIIDVLDWQPVTKTRDINIVVDEVLGEVEIVKKSTKIYTAEEIYKIACQQYVEDEDPEYASLL